jgi:signal transduction histidine kinase
MWVIVIVLIVILSLSNLYFYKKSRVAKLELNKKQDDIDDLKANLEISYNKFVESDKNNKVLNTFKNSFLTNISYEIRNPLNVILGYINLLSKNLKTESNTYYVNQILQATDSLMNITDNLLDFSKIEAGKMILGQVDFSPLKVVTRSILALKYKAEENDIKLEIHIDPFIPKMVNGDPDKLSQILINLISNAIKFSDRGQTVTIEAKCESMKSECKLLFTITDFGIGIPESKLESIFDSFSYENSNTAKFKGTGLNLSIVKQLILMQKGDVKVESEKDKGTRFSFYITYKIVSNSDEVVESKKSTNLKKYKILLVEDDPTNQELAKDTILSWGDAFTVSVANNGQVAIDILEKENFDLVLMDIQMPTMDGHEATQYIRNKLPAPNCNIPIIGLTAHALLSEKEQAISNGMNECIVKPFYPNILKQKIDDLLKI